MALVPVPCGELVPSRDAIAVFKTEQLLSYLSRLNWANFFWRYPLNANRPANIPG